MLLVPRLSFAQNESFSFEIIMSPGDSTREAGDLPGSIPAYQKNIARISSSRPADSSVDRSMYFTDLYNLACAFSRTGQQDSALKYLGRSISEGKDSSTEALSDPDFLQLRKHAGWPAVEDRMIAFYEGTSARKIKDRNYAKLLWHMLAADQAYYRELSVAEKKTGKGSAVVFALWDLKQQLNEDNQNRLEASIKTKGWPKISEVGARPASAAFLVIQHSDLKKQQQYLPVIESLCKTGEARWQDYALMYDRIQTSLGKPQRYGSQVRYNGETQKYEIFALEDASKVEQWREEAGLQPLAKYLENWKISWPGK